MVTVLKHNEANQICKTLRRLRIFLALLGFNVYGEERTEDEQSIDIESH